MQTLAFVSTKEFFFFKVVFHTLILIKTLDKQVLKKFMGTLQPPLGVTIHQERISLFKTVPLKDSEAGVVEYS